jgi:hypothetical protein
MKSPGHAHLRAIRQMPGLHPSALAATIAAGREELGATTGYRANRAGARLVGAPT